MAKAPTTTATAAATASPTLAAGSLPTTIDPATGEVFSAEDYMAADEMVIDVVDGPTLVRTLKMTAAGLSGDAIRPYLASLPEGQRRDVPVCNVIGEITGFSTRKMDAASKKPISECAPDELCTVLDGNFEFENLITGKAYQAGSAFLPDAVHRVILSMYGLAVKAGKVSEKSPAPMAVQIMANTHNSAIGYSLTARSLLAAKKSMDGLARIKAAIAKGPEQKSLPAPDGVTIDG